MQKSLSKKRLLTRRVLPFVLVLTLVLSTVVVAFSMLSAVAAGVAQNEVVYFNLTRNSSWYTNGSGTLYARFYNGGVPVGNVVCSSQGSNIYKATAPAAADSVQLAVYNADSKKNIVLNNAKNNRVYFDNTVPNYGRPYVYNWKDANNNDGAWPGKDYGMTLLSDKMYYYDITKGSDYKYVIFSDHGANKTADLTVPDDLAYWNGSSWVDIFTKSTSKLNLSGKASDANEIYLDGSNLVLSKYQYPDHNNRTMREVYVYNPNWTGNTVYVQYDLSDPYQGFFAMNKVSGKPAGFFKGSVPADAEFKFFATTAGVGGSIQTTCPNDTNLNCYKMGSGAETWVKLEDAQKITANYFADKQTTGDSNAKAFWVDATYYDYLTDAELTNGWLKPDKIGTFYSEANHNADKDCWYPFYQFNNYINGKTAGVTYPLFFGNFCNTDGSYPYNFLRNGGYGKAIEDLTNFNYIANNSNGLPLYNYSVQGLAADSLSSSGDIRFPNGTAMPYFQQQTATDNYAKSVQSYFPFRSSTVGSGNNQVTTYSFNSKDARDNVFFKWNNGTPASVNYGQGTNYGVQDGLADFEYTASRWGSGDGQDHPGYGIFPFNNKNNGNGNPGNGKLDYGFGVRMDMNFRVPAGGVLPNGNDVKFSFTGDDDLWVYLSPVNDDGTIDYANSQLALDLGGAHKEASGNINFRTMKSNVTYGSTIKSSSYGSDMMIIKDTSNWGKVSLWAWSDSVSGGWFDGVSMGNNEYYIKASTVGSNGKKFGEMKYFFFNKGRSWDTVNTNTFKNNGNYEEWPGFTNSEGGQDRTPFLVQTHFGRRTYIDHGSYTEKLDSNWYTASSNKTADLNKSKLGVSGTLDPTKMYHMTVFYMERGLIESNASMEFTMTPAQNDYKVEKIVNTAQLNTGVAKAMRTKDQFNFSTDGTYAGSSITRSDAKLAHGEVKDYENQFDTNTYLQTSEGSVVVKNSNNTASTTQYTTSWVVADTDTGQVVAQSASGEDSKETSQFLLKRQDTSLDSIHLKSTFTNTPVTDNVTVKKQIINEDGTPSDKIMTFNYTMKVDLDGSGSRYTYTAYPLDYTVGGHAARMTSAGEFSFRSDQTVTIANLPKNATFTIEEAKEAGFTPNQKVITGTVGTKKTVTFVNKVTPSTDKIKGFKKLNGNNYTGNMFTFRLEGLPGPDGDTDYIDESSTTFDPITQVTNGVIEFNLSYDSDDVGKHRYKFYEDTSALGNLGSDFKFVDNVWYVEVNVIREGTDLEIESVKYFRPVGYDNPDDAASAPDPEVDLNATFAGAALSEAEFQNFVTPGSITVYKTDSAGRATEDVDNITFHVYKVSGDGAAIPDGASPAQTQITSETEVTVLDDFGQPVQKRDSHNQLVYDNDGKPVYETAMQHGIAQFTNLDIYTDMSCSDFVQNPYQWYCLVEEYTDSNGFNRNETKMYFKFPTAGKYDFIAPYVNGILKQPETSGWGTAALKTAGITIMALSAIGFIVYMIYIRKPSRGKRKYAPKRYSK